MEAKKNLVLVDFEAPDDWEFIKVLNLVGGGNWKVIAKRTNHLHKGKLLNIMRIAWYYVFPLKILRHRKHIGKIIAWQQFHGLNYAFFCRLLHLNKVNELTVMTFIYKKKSGIAGRLYHSYMKYIITSKYIDRFICFSKEECKYYAKEFGVVGSKFVFVPLGKSLASEIKTSDNGSIFATGRSNRNYDFLIECVKELPYRTTIACNGYSYHKGHFDNVELLNDCLAKIC